MLAHYQMGQVMIHGGKLASATTHHTQVLALYNPQEHHDLVLRYGSDLGVGAHCFLSFELWQLGYPDQARHHIHEAYRLAQNLSHPYSQTLAEVFAAFLSQFCRDVPATQKQAEATRSLTTEQGFAFYAAHGVILHGWTLVMRGQHEAGMAEMRKGYHASLEMGAKVFQGYYLGLLAEASGHSGCPEAGFPLLAEGMALGETTELRFFASELHRLQGELLIQKPVPDASQAAACFHQALAIACQQQAKSWELRAATSLAKLWQSQGKRQDAYDLLAPVYEWFTEGFDTADLQEAKTWLSALAD
jgi:predicted ATPase